jgi:hypothetical protein
VFDVKGMIANRPKDAPLVPKQDAVAGPLDGFRQGIKTVH